MVLRCFIPHRIVRQRVVVAAAWPALLLFMDKIASSWYFTIGVSKKVDTFFFDFGLYAVILLQ
jgi:hypothetical protein